MSSTEPVPTQDAERLPRNVKVLGLASLLNDIGSEMIFPLLPYFLTRELGGTRFHLGIIEGVADSAASVLKLWSGGWSDRAGRRKGFLLFGYSMTTIVRPVVSVIMAPWQLFLVRVCDRFGKGIRSAPRDALIADSTPAALRGRAFGFNRAMDHLGAAIGPLLAAAFLWFWPEQLRLLFFLTLLPGLAVVLLLVFFLREAAPPGGEKKPAGPRLQLTLKPFDWNFRLYLLALFVFTLGNSSDAFLLERARELGVHVDLLPFLWCVFHVVKSTANIVLGRAVDRFGSRLFLFLGWLVYAGVYLAFAWASSAWEVWTFFLIYAVFYGLTEPAEKTLVAELVGPERKGLAYGWFNFAIGIGTLPASVIFGALYQYFGAETAFGWGACLALVSVVLLMFVRSPRRAKETVDQ